MSGARNGWMPVEGEDIYEDQIKDLKLDLFDVMENYIDSFKKLGEEHGGDEADQKALKEMLISFYRQQLPLLNKILKPTGERIGNLIRELGSLVESLSEQWNEVPAKLDLLKQQREELASIKMVIEAKLAAKKVVKEGKLAEADSIQILTHAVTFVPADERDISCARDASNKSKLASKQHHADKKNVIEAHQAQYPAESSPMFVKHRFFKTAEASTSKYQLVKEELSAYQLGENDMRNDMKAMANDAWEDDMVERMALLEEAAEFNKLMM